MIRIREENVQKADLSKAEIRLNIQLTHCVSASQPKRRSVANCKVTIPIRYAYVCIRF
jgi:hypothetical protein